MQHIYPIYCGTMPEADAAVAMIGTWIVPACREGRPGSDEGFLGSNPQEEDRLAPVTKTAV